jgi:hypothetical protein
VPKNLFGGKKGGSIHPSPRKAAVRVKNHLTFASGYMKWAGGEGALYIRNSKTIIIKGFYIR